MRKAKTVGRIHAAVMVKEEEEWPWPPGFLPRWDGTEQSLFDAWENRQRLYGAPQLFASVSYTYSQQLAEQEYQKKEVCPVEEIVPGHYHEFLEVFSKEASEHLPEHGPYDHAIELVPDARMFHSKVYPCHPANRLSLTSFLTRTWPKDIFRS